MTSKPPPASKPEPFNVTTASFEQLRKQFDQSACEAESFSLATSMVARFPSESQALLPLKVDPQRLDFNGNKTLDSYEWAAALTAAKKLKIETGVELTVGKTDQVIEKACEIYNQTRKDKQRCVPS